MSAFIPMNCCRNLLFFMLIVVLPNNVFSAHDTVEVQALADEQLTLDRPIYYHIQAASNCLQSSTVNLTSVDAWLFFDNVKPSEVMKNYGSFITIDGEALEPFVNCRVVVYKQGTVIIPHSASFKPLEAFTERGFQGESEKFTIDQYYSNAHINDIPVNRREPLLLDNSIYSIKLKRGYMATLANESDGMGYSRCFVADKEDLEFDLPNELAGKISFIRVFPWEWTSKKGWAGSYWPEITEGLKYVDQQSDLTNSTWYYTWGARVTGNRPGITETNLLNQEFVPEKWGKGGSVAAFYENKRWAHLLGANEPDHVEQSNVSVEEAIEEWPILMKTGARLGSPATTDFNWLYRFIDECDVRNYRVDYVVIHAYWGGKNPSSWYNEMKKVHERTGRPVWIKEWNNGANWTNESGWNGKNYNEHNANKQLNDLKGILQVMDTASFIERYSIYNWVQDCRAIILSDGRLTKAGEFYAANSPGLAYNPDKEYVSQWFPQNPTLSCTFMPEQRSILLLWDDPNRELTEQIIIEQSFDSKTWNRAGIINSSYTSEYNIPSLLSDEIPDGEVYYRIKINGVYDKEMVSQPIKYEYLKNNGNKLVQTLELKTKESWSIFLFEQAFKNQQTVLLGPPTYRNRYPIAPRLRNVTNESLEVQLALFDYIVKDNNPSFMIPDTLSLALLPNGYHQFGEVVVQADTIHNIGKAWKTIEFPTAFETLPVVFATQITANDKTASAIRIKNVTKRGFDVSRKYEPGKPNMFENISYAAATPGVGEFGENQIIEVGMTNEAIGNSYSNPAKINFQREHKNPAFFGFMQSCNDEVAATLRIKTRSSQFVELFKDREKSMTTTNPSEIIGWMVLSETVEPNSVEANSWNPLRLIYDQEQSILYSSESEELFDSIKIISLEGNLLLSEKNVQCVDVSRLNSGVYLVLVNNTSVVKIVK